MASIKQKSKYLLGVILTLFLCVLPQISFAVTCPEGTMAYSQPYATGGAFGQAGQAEEAYNNCKEDAEGYKKQGATTAECIRVSSGYYHLCVNTDFVEATDTWSDSWIFKHALNPLLAGINSLLAKIIKIAANGTDAMLVMAFYIPDILKDVWQDLVNFANIILAGLLVLVSVMMVIGIKQDNYAIKKI